jgi:transposase-like protein
MAEKPNRQNFRYSAEYKARAVRMVRQLREEMGFNHGTVKRVADQVGCNPETLRQWVWRDDTARAEADGSAMTDAERVIQLEQEVRELRRANDILKSASAFFAAELDRPQN